MNLYIHVAMSSVSRIYKVESQMSCKGRLNLQDKTSVYLVWNKITPSCFMQRKSDHPWPDKPPSLCCRPYLTSEGKYVARHLNSSCYRKSWFLIPDVWCRPGLEILPSGLFLFILSYSWGVREVFKRSQQRAEDRSVAQVHYKHRHQM